MDENCDNFAHLKPLVFSFRDAETGELFDLNLDPQAYTLEQDVPSEAEGTESHRGHHGHHADASEQATTGGILPVSTKKCASAFMPMSFGATEEEEDEVWTETPHNDMCQITVEI